MSELTPGVLSLDKGIDLQTAKIVAPQGTSFDMLNYEQVDFKGQKRIDGYARYDGQLLSAVDEYYKITLNYTGALPNPNDFMYSPSGGLSAVIVDRDTPSGATVVIYICLLNNTLLPLVGDALTFKTRALVARTGTYHVATISTGTESGVAADVHYANLLSYNDTLRGTVGTLPGAVIGLHWFRDRLYAVADIAVVRLLGATPLIYPNDTLVSNSISVKVLDSYVDSGTRVVFINSVKPDLWATLGYTVLRNGTSVGLVGLPTPIPVASQMASFYQSRTETQTIAEDGAGPYTFGWKFVDHGWSVNFKSGNTLYGSLPALNENITGLGIQGPTSIGGESGSALLLAQKLVVTGKVAQVNGWKDSDTPASYQLSSSNIADTDGTYVYADAYISWNGATGAVTAPGLTDANLIEYPATNTVVITIP